MKFLSIKEYFYKINTIGFILLLMPLMLYIFLYMQSANSVPEITAEESVLILLGGTVLVFLIDLMIVQMMLNMRLKKYRKRTELASRMDGYFSIAVIRMAAYCGGALLTVVGFFLTGSSYFTALDGIRRVRQLNAQLVFEAAHELRRQRQRGLPALLPGGQRGQKGVEFGHGWKFTRLRLQEQATTDNGARYGQCVLGSGQRRFADRNGSANPATSRGGCRSNTKAAGPCPP